METVKLPEYTSEQVRLFDNLPSSVMINVLNDEGRLEYAYSNPFLAESLGYTHEEFKALLTENCFAAIYDADRAKTMNAREKVMTGQIVDSITRQKRKDGSFMWILCHIRLIKLDGRVGMLFLFSKIQDLIGLQNELSAKNETFSDIIKSVPIGLVVYKEENGVRTTLSINHFLIEFANSAGTMLDNRKREWTEAEIAMILNHDIYAFCDDSDVPKVSAMLKESETRAFASCTFKLRGSKAENTVYIYTTCASKETGENCRTYYVTYQNVTDDENRRIELSQKQAQLYRMSYYDAMTGVKNRNAYNKFAELCKITHAYNVGFAFCDINGLKKTNDSLGHYYGDKLIKSFTSIVREFFDTECIYRISGDEFVIICQDVDRDVFMEKMEALLARVREEESIASIGYIWKENVSDVQRRTTQAESIMYIEKQKYYETSSTITSKHRPRMLEALLKEFNEGRYVMYLQPKTAIDGSRVIGAEALVRKIDADGKIIQPYAFVPQMEHERLIPMLDLFMLERTCEFLQEQHRAGNDDFSVSVNVSRVTIVENDYIQTVTSILDKYYFNRENLELELTESNKTFDSVKLEDYLIQLKKLGVKISLDDMGTDYSTLSLLTLDGIDWVKLDRSLIIQLGNDKDAVLVKHIINTCHDLNLKVIAEGVEDDAVRMLLMEMGCDAYQGYLKSKPIPTAEFKERFLN